MAEKNGKGAKEEKTGERPETDAKRPARKEWRRPNFRKTKVGDSEIGG